MANYINKDLYVGDTGKQLKDIATNASNINTNASNISTLDSQVSQNTSDISALRTLISQKGLKVGIMTSPGNRSYSASAWNRPNVYYENFDTTDTNYFSRQDNYNMLIKKPGTYLAFISRETTIGDDTEQDSYVMLNGSWYQRTCYHNVLSYMVMFATTSANQVIRNDINTGKTSWTVRNATMAVIRISGD